MHPTDKTFKALRESNAHLTERNSDLRDQLSAAKSEISTLQNAISTLQKKNNELSTLYLKLQKSTHHAPRSSVQLTQERTTLFTAVEHFIQNYSGPRPYYTQSPPPAQRLGSFIPATQLFELFLSSPHPAHSSSLRYPPTFRIFCKQLTLLGLAKIRARQPGTSKGHYRTRERKRDNGRLVEVMTRPEEAKIYLFLVPHSTSTPLK